MADAVLSIEDKALFEDTVALCRTMRAQKKLCSGVEFFINDHNIISMRPATPVVARGEQPPDIEAAIRDALGAYQELREWLSRAFNMDSDSWNTSNIGMAVRMIEHDLRTETYKVENRAAAKGENDVYNVFTIIALGESAIELFRLVLAPSFSRKWRWQKLRALNEFGDAFMQRRRRLKALQAMSMAAEFMMAVDDLLKSGSNPGAESFIASVATKGALLRLKKSFEDMQ